MDEITLVSNLNTLKNQDFANKLCDQNQLMHDQNHNIFVLVKECMNQRRLKTTLQPH